MKKIQREKEKGREEGHEREKEGRGGRRGGEWEELKPVSSMKRSSQIDPSLSYPPITYKLFL